MKKIALLLILTLSAQSLSITDSGSVTNTDKEKGIQRSIDINCSQVLRKQKFSICYDYNLKIPLIASYYLTPEDIKAPKQKRKYLHIDKEIPKEFRPSMGDYKGSKKDAGHLPATGSVDLTLSMAHEVLSVNFCAPQDPKINRGLWRYIENRERFLASKKKILVITGVIPSKNNTIGINHKLNVPVNYWKLIYMLEDSTYEFYIVPNDKKDLLEGKMTDIEKYRQKEVEKLTGLKFYGFKNISKDENITLGKKQEVKPLTIMEKIKNIFK